MNDNAPDENQLIAERRAKLAAIRAQANAFPNDFARADLASDLHAAHGEAPREALESTKPRVAVAGRMMLKRVMGKASFATIQDGSGQIQLFISDDATGADSHAAVKHHDLGDILAAEGTLFKTKTGELSVKVSKLRLITKSLRPLPDKFHGLADQETKYRQRYVDLIMNEETRRTFKARTAAMSSIRRFMSDNGFMEVETPMLHAIPGGAAARPFRTHHHALDTDMFLRIAPELYLKRLVVGGIEKVYEINRSFRNEGISTRHNPEFTMMEVYCAFTNHLYMVELMEDLIRTAAQDGVGSMKVTYQGREIDFEKPFFKATMTEAIQRYAPDEHWTPAQLRDRVFLAMKLTELGVAVADGEGWGALQVKLFETIAEKHLLAPTFVLDYPAEVSPLARRKDKDPELTERFELFIDGKEIANGFSELNDPEDQAERFREQARRKDAGDHEAMHYDADYIRAMEYGLPPTSGAGLGIDRLVMLLTDSASIRDVILFPSLRPEGE